MKAVIVWKDAPRYPDVRFGDLQVGETFRSKYPTEPEGPTVYVKAAPSEPLYRSNREIWAVALGSGRIYRFSPEKVVVRVKVEVVASELVQVQV